ncbi:MAG: NAD(P)/FAD-dependent oxidoreductase [Candidatus Korobacteraceae bacterium]
MADTTLRVIIVGAGFGGLNAARKLANKPMSVTILDRKNHHTFQPLLYQVATAGLSPGEIAYPIRAVFRDKKNIEVLLDEVIGFDLGQRQANLHGYSLGYDFLIVGAGATHAYFGHQEWAPMAPGLKTVEDATEIRRRILLAFEIAERRASLEGRHTPLNFVIVGAGPTGVELAGAVAEIAHRVVAGNFRAIDPTAARVILVEAGPRVLPAYSEDLSLSAERQLKKLRVEVMTNSKVTGIEPHAVHLGGTVLEAAVILWAAGVAASPLGRMLDSPLDRAGRVLVRPDLTIPGHPEVFVIGDMAAVTQADGSLVPGVAPAAIQMGEYAAQTILDDGNGKPRKPFHYWDKGSLATIGRNAGIAQIGRLHLSGFIAWLAWLVVHVYFLIGFRNRLQVLWEWAWAYFRFQRGARLITGRSDAITPVEDYGDAVRPREVPQPAPAPDRKAS